MSRFDEVDEEEETDEEPAVPETEDRPETPDGPNSGSGNSNTTEDHTMSEAETSEVDDSDNDTTQEPPYQQPPQHPIHVRDDYWNEYKDTVNFDVQSVLARNNNIRNAKFYEANTAMIRLAAASPKALTKLILDERGVDVDLSDIGE